MSDEKPKRHVSRHKKKYTVAAILAMAFAALELIPAIKHAITTGDTSQIGKVGKQQLLELQDAGVDF